MINLNKWICTLVCFFNAFIVHLGGANTSEVAGHVVGSSLLSFKEIQVKITYFKSAMFICVVFQNNGIDISPGTALSIAFNRVEYQKRSRTGRLNKNQRFECVDSRDWGKYLLKTSKNSIRGTEYATASDMLCDQTCASMLVNFHHIRYPMLGTLVFLARKSGIKFRIVQKIQ